MTERWVCIHGHFYQPPRENPWLDAIEPQPSAAPYADWNARITAECYRPNAWARIVDGQGRITAIVDNYARISSDVGPTLMSWLAREAPDVHAAVVEADRAGASRFDGHGPAMAQAYHHLIMPLCSARDRRTQVAWGVRDFERPKDVTLSYAYALMGHIQLKLNNLTEAYTTLNIAYALALKNSQLETLSEVCMDISSYWERMQRPDSALHYYKRYHTYFNQYLDEDNIRKLSYQAAEFKCEQQSKPLELERLQTESRNRSIQLLLALVIAGLAIGFILLYFRYKLGQNKLVQSQLEKQNVTNELEFRNKELTTTVMHQLKNKEFIIRLAEKLKQAKITDNPVYRNLVNEILSEIEFDSNDDAWKEFEICFQRVHVDFYKKLGESYPDLSSNEIRLCAYLKLNLGTKDIAAITYQTTLT